MDSRWKSVYDFVVEPSIQTNVEEFLWWDIQSAAWTDTCEDIVASIMVANEKI